MVILLMVILLMNIMVILLMVILLMNIMVIVLMVIHGNFWLFY